MTIIIFWSTDEPETNKMQNVVLVFSHSNLLGIVWQSRK